MPLPPFATLATAPAARLDQLALALAAELRGPVDADATLVELDRLGLELAGALDAGDGTPHAEATACTELLGETYGFEGDDDEYDHPDNSMLDLVVARRVGLPILLSVVYVEVARRARVRLEGVGLSGHFVVGHFGVRPPILLDPFDGGCRVDPRVEPAEVRPWTAHETALRMLNNLVGSYERRGDFGRAIRAAELRLLLPTAPELREELELGLKTVRARLN
jgi:regulator of sirC expression with transglutaminase-like and TPR domain